MSHNYKNFFILSSSYMYLYVAYTGNGKDSHQLVTSSPNA